LADVASSICQEASNALDDAHSQYLAGPTVGMLRAAMRVVT
jgi:hypothetical protein